MPKVFRIHLLIALTITCSPLRQALAILDLDSDGMSDVWESAYGAKTLSPSSDPDGDGKTTLQEAQAGTNPLDARSLLAIREIKSLATNEIQLKWPSVAGKRYQVQGSSDLLSWSEVGGLIAGTGAEASITLPLSSSLTNGRVTVSRWQNIPFPTPFSILQTYIAGNVPPTASFDLNIVETPPGSLDNFGQWLRGWVIPPTTGNYTFWISADQEGEFWLSSTPSRANKVLVASTAYAWFHEWDRYPSQRSVEIPLVAHQPYYFEVLQKATWGGDHVSIAWTGPGLTLPLELLSQRYISSSPLTLRDESRTGGVYFRVVVSDTDTDGDTISDADELLIGFDPNDATTRPRISDRDSIAQTIIATNVVTVGSPASRAYESTNQPGRFVFSRSGNVNALTIQYTVSGTASPAADYTPLSGTIYLGVAQNSVELPVTPLSDALLEAGETVKVTIAASSTYQIGSQATATVTIDDAPDQLFVATLRPPTTTASSGYGSAALSLAGNDVFATQNLSFSNLTTTQVRSELYISTNGASGPAVLSLPAGQVSPQRWDLLPAAGYTKAQIVTAIKNGQLWARVISNRFPTGEILGQFVREQGWQTMPIPPAAPPFSLSNPTPQDASRFLTQATFGPTGPEITRFLTLGYDAWLQEQRTLPATLHRPYVQARRAELFSRHGTDGYQRPRQEAWWQAALAAPDQLRQRMAFALSELFVVSDEGVLGVSHEQVTKYYDILVSRAFGNYRDLFKEVTLSPIMGEYLTLVRSQKPNPETGSSPDENFAREAMQLFSVGLHQLHPDGSVKLGPDALPIRTYDQAAVSGLARALSGWGFYYPPGNPQPSFIWGPREEWNPMVQYPDYHDTSAKTILNGINIPAGLSGEQELEIALDALFNHPNVGPMMARHLIQRFVTSNPSPGYIHRVAAVFNNNGSGVRGDLWATLRAVLVDYEARSSLLLSDLGWGKLREPILRASHMFRCLNARPPKPGDPRFFIDLNGALPQSPLKAPSVFNFFQPGYVNPGRIAAAGLLSPEFQILSETNTISQINVQHTAIFWGQWSAELDANNQYVYIQMDHSEEIALLNRVGFTDLQNQQALLDLLNLRLLSGRMSAGLRQQITEFFAELPWWYTGDEAQRQRVKVAAYLILASPEYVIQK